MGRTGYQTQNIYTNQQRFEKSQGITQKVFDTRSGNATIASDVQSTAETKNIITRNRVLNSRSIKKRFKQQEKKETQQDEYAKETKRHLMDLAFKDLKSELGDFKTNSQRDPKNISIDAKTVDPLFQEFREVADQMNLRPIFHGRQSDALIAYTEKAASSQVVGSNISNYKQVIQKISYRNPAPPTKSKSKLSKNETFNLEKKYFKYDRAGNANKNRYIHGCFQEHKIPFVHQKGDAKAKT